MIDIRVNVEYFASLFGCMIFNILSESIYISFIGKFSVFLLQEYWKPLLPENIAAITNKRQR